MTVGVKFCGGCNPIFDRGEQYKKLIERSPGVKFESYNENKSYEKLLLICGCERTCLRFREEFKADELIIVGSEREMAEITF